MNADQLKVFNDNVVIDNNNVHILENATKANRNAIIAVFDYAQNADFWWMMILFVVLVYLFLVNYRISYLEQRVEELEERGPEMEPLLARPTKV